MSQASLVTDLQASLMDCAAMFTMAGNGDAIRQLNAAADDLPRFAPEFVQGTLTLVDCQSLYAAPADLKSTDRLLWGEELRNMNPWDHGYIRRLPRLSTVTQGGVKYVQLSPAPNSIMIAQLGSSADFTYRQLFAISTTAADTTVPVYRRSLLLLRAQAEAMKELANRGVAKPVQLRDGVTQGPRNGSPAALFQTFMDECQRQAA